MIWEHTHAWINLQSAVEIGLAMHDYRQTHTMYIVCIVMMYAVKYTLTYTEKNSYRQKEKAHGVVHVFCFMILNTDQMFKYTVWIKGSTQRWPWKLLFLGAGYVAVSLPHGGYSVCWLKPHAMPRLWFHFSLCVFMEAQDKWIVV